MDSLITKRQKNIIMVLGVIASLFGAAAGAIGLYLRTELTAEISEWKAGLLPQFTDGYFGVMSGFIVFLLGTVGCLLVYSRISFLVFLYGLLSLLCSVLCILDTIMVIYYTKDNGKFAWERTECPNANNTINSSNVTKITTSSANLLQNKETCGDIKTISILLICITGTVLITFLVTIVMGVVTCVAFCRARAVSASDQPGVPLSPFSMIQSFEPTNYNNAIYQNDGY